MVNEPDSMMTTPFDDVPCRPLVVPLVGFARPPPHPQCPPQAAELPAFYFFEALLGQVPIVATIYRRSRRAAVP